KQDEQLAVEALKLLGMAGTAVGKHLHAIDSLASNGDSSAASRIASGLAARLRAMGCEAPSDDGAAAANRREVARLVADLDDETDADTITKLAATPAAWPLLVKRFAEEGKQTPDAVFEVIAQLGWLMSEAERTNMSYCVALVGGERWDASMMSTSSGGSSLETIHKLTHAQLQVDPAATPTEL